eukprot:1790358-Pleurochrysis_carterae.AAC.2
MKQVEDCNLDLLRVWQVRQSPGVAIRLIQSVVRLRVECDAKRRPFHERTHTHMHEPAQAHAQAHAQACARACGHSDVHNTHAHDTCA